MHMKLQAHNEEDTYCILQFRYTAGVMLYVEYLYTVKVVDWEVSNLIRHDW